MTTDDIPKDAPLLRCWLKKSWSTSKKVGLWLGGIAVVLIAAHIAWLGLTSQIAAKIWSAVTGWCGSVITGTLNYIAAIPPLMFWGSVIVGVVITGILAYSLMWCIARNLQDCDWTSDNASALAFASLTFALAFTAFALAFTAFALALALAFAFALALALAFADNPSSMWYYVFRFIGAYLHYRARIKAAKSNTEE